MTGRIITTQIIVTLHHPAAATNPVTPVFPALRDRRAVLDLREFQARKDQWVLRVLPEETEQQVRLVRRVSRDRPAEMETPVPPARQANRGRPAEMEAPVRPVRQVHRDRQAGTETPARPVRRAHRDQQDLQGRMAPQGHRGSLEKPGRLALRAGPELMEPTEPTVMSAPRE